MIEPLLGGKPIKTQENARVRLGLVWGMRGQRPGLLSFEALRGMADVFRIPEGWERPLPPWALDKVLVIDVNGDSPWPHNVKAPVACWFLGSVDIDRARQCEWIFCARREDAAFTEEQGLPAFWLPPAASRTDLQELTLRPSLPYRWGSWPVADETLATGLASAFPGVTGRESESAYTGIYWNSETLALSDIYDLILAGAVPIIGPSHDVRAFYRPGREVLVCATAEEAIHAVQNLSQDIDKWFRMASRARSATFSRHTYLNRMAAVLETMAGIPANSQRAYYRLDRPELQELVPREARAILDIGCGTGALGSAIRRRQSCRVEGVEVNAWAAKQARRVLDRVHCAPIEILDRELGWYDAIIMGDVLEHVADTDGVLRLVHRHLMPHGSLIVSVPNVGHGSVVQALIAGQFEYQSAGILDQTHLRFYTLSSLSQKLEANGFRPVAVGQVLLDDVQSKAWRRQIGSVSGTDSFETQGAVYQYLWVCRPLASVANTNPLSLADGRPERHT